MLVYKENPKESIQKELLELISEFSKVTEYKISIEESITYIHTNSEHTETKIKSSIIYSHSKENKLLWNTLTKHV